MLGGRGKKNPNLCIVIDVQNPNIISASLMKKETPRTSIWRLHQIILLFRFNMPPVVIFVLSALSDTKSMSIVFLGGSNTEYSAWTTVMSTRR